MVLKWFFHEWVAFERVFALWEQRTLKILFFPAKLHSRDSMIGLSALPNSSILFTSWLIKHLILQSCSASVYQFYPDIFSCFGSVIFHGMETK